MIHVGNKIRVSHRIDLAVGSPDTSAAGDLGRRSCLLFHLQSCTVATL